MSKALEEKHITPITAEPTRIPVTTVELSEEEAKDVLELVDKTGARRRCAEGLLQSQMRRVTRKMEL